MTLKILGKKKRYCTITCCNGSIFSLLTLFYFFYSFDVYFFLNLLNALFFILSFIFYATALSMSIDEALNH
jgi:hypothetical protein